VFNNNDVAEIVNGLRIYLIFPLLLLLLFVTFTDTELEVSMRKSVYLSIIIIIIFAFSSFLNALDLFPINLNSLVYDNEKNVGVHEGFFHIINSPLSSLIFLLPFYFRNLTDRISFRNPEMYVLFFAFFICVLSSRRILLLPFIFIYILNFKRLKYVTILLGCLLTYLILNGIISGIFIDTFFQRLSDAINETGDSQVRDIQIKMFIKYIENSPFIGYGIGGYMPDYLRNEDYKTAYESTFYYLVFVFGIPLAILFSIFYVNLFLKNYFNFRFSEFYRKGLCIGSLCLLISSYTNPYWMSSFDFIIPFALLLRSAKL